MTWTQYIQDGISAVRRGDGSAAEQCLINALQHAKSNFARSDGRLALNLSLLGHVYFTAGNFSKAEKLLEQSLRLHADSSQLNDPCVVMDLFTLAEIKQAQGKKQEAWQVLDETLPKIRKAKPFQPTVIDQATETLARLAEQIRPATMRGADETISAPPEAPASKPDSAPSAAAAPVANAKEPLPLPQMEYAQTAGKEEIWQQQFQTGIASMKMEDAEWEELTTAYLNLESAYRLAVQMFSRGDTRLIATVNALADASSKLYLFDQAEALYRQALAQSSASAALNPMRLALGCLYVEAGQFALAKTIFDTEQLDDLPDEAERLHKRLSNAQKLLKAYLGCELLLSQAQTAEQLGDLDRAAKLTNNALSQLKQAFPPQHLEHAKLLRYRSSLLARLGNSEQAEEFEKRAERIERTNSIEQEDHARRTAELPRVEPDQVPA